MVSMSLRMVVDVVVLSVMGSFVSRYSAKAHARMCVPISSAIGRHLYIMISRGTMYGAGGPLMATTHGPVGTACSAVHGPGGQVKARTTTASQLAHNTRKVEVVGSSHRQLTFIFYCIIYFTQRLESQQI